MPGACEVVLAAAGALPPAAAVEDEAPVPTHRSGSATAQKVVLPWGASAMLEPGRMNGKAWDKQWGKQGDQQRKGRGRGGGGKRVSCRIEDEDPGLYSHKV
jgi:hypothetical protein